MKYLILLMLSASSFASEFPHAKHMNNLSSSGDIESNKREADILKKFKLDISERITSAATGGKSYITVSVPREIADKYETLICIELAISGYSVDLLMYPSYTKLNITWDGKDKAKCTAHHLTKGE